MKKQTLQSNLSAVKAFKMNLVSGIYIPVKIHSQVKPAFKLPSNLP